MKLELKHFVGYPKTLGLLLDGNVFNTLEGLDFTHGSVIAERINYKPEEVVPLLRPLSDIMNEITHEGETFIPLDKLKERWGYIKWEKNERKLCIYFDLEFQDDGDYEGNVGTWFTYEDWEGDLNENLPKWVWDSLQEWHFDVYDLLSQDLAKKLSDKPINKGYE